MKLPNYLIHFKDYHIQVYDLFIVDGEVLEIPYRMFFRIHNDKLHPIIKNINLN